MEKIELQPTQRLIAKGKDITHDIVSCHFIIDLLYKTHFLDSKGIRNQINVNPLFGLQKGTFSPFLSVSSNYDRPLCHYDRANV